ncbi:MULTISPECIES: energy transducer TonB [Glaesserella]|nr:MULTISPECIES: energy transducer TonB [Glaesserella]
MLFVTLIHLGLAYSLSRLSWERNLDLFGDLENLQMIEVNLGSEVPIEVKTESEPEPEVVKAPEEILSSDMPKPTQADLAKKPEAPEKPKLVKEIKKVPEKVVKKPEKKKEPKPKAEKPKAEKTVVASQSTNAPQGHQNGVEGSKSTVGNAKVDASLGAGYGSAMRGRCSDISDESDDVGSVKLKVTIGTNGKASHVEILSSSGIKRLDNQASRMASGHHYQPAKINGSAVVGSVIFTIHFKCGAAA